MVNTGVFSWQGWLRGRRRPTRRSWSAQSAGQSRRISSPRRRAEGI